MIDATRSDNGPPCVFKQCPHRATGRHPVLFAWVCSRHGGPDTVTGRLEALLDAAREFRDTLALDGEESPELLTLVAATTALDGVIPFAAVSDPAPVARPSTMEHTPKAAEGHLSESTATATARVRAALTTTQEHAPGHLRALCASRAGNDPAAAGSVYDGLTPASVLYAWQNAAWTPYAHPDVMPGCVAYWTHIAGGRLGLVEIDALPRDAVLVLADPKKTGYVEATVAGVRGDATDVTVIMLGDEAGREIVFTAHPGAPIAPSRVPTAECPHGTTLGPDAAAALGLRFAKIVTAAP